VEVPSNQAVMIFDEGNNHIRVRKIPGPFAIPFGKESMPQWTVKVNVSTDPGLQKGEAGKSARQGDFYFGAQIDNGRE